MSKRIAFQRGLESIAEELKQKGYIIFPYEGTSEPYDALLYYEEESSAFFKNLQAVSVSSQASPSAPGVFMVNVKGKSTPEIIRMIERKTYTPIF